MDINTFADEAYLSAELKGLWDEIDYRTAASLIHCEWSEALQEDRAKRPLYFHRCSGNDDEYDICEDANKAACYYKTSGNEEVCTYKGKPEGVAVELIDGITLICSTVRRYGCRFRIKDTSEYKDWIPEKYVGFTSKTPLPHLVCILHDLVSKSAVMAVLCKPAVDILSPLEDAVGLAWLWIEMQGADPEEILIEKHKYNKTREYKHGRKY